MASKTHIKDLILGQDQMDFPNNDGADGQVLTTDGELNITWQDPYANITLQDLQNVTATPTSGQFLKWDGSSWVTDVVTAATPDLSAVLDESDSYGSNGDVIYKTPLGWTAAAASNLNISLDDVVSNGGTTSSSISVNGITAGSINLNSLAGGVNQTGTFGTNTFASVINADGGLRVEDEYDLPSADGTDGQVLTTDGSGNTSFQDPWANMGIEDLQDVSSGIFGKRLLYKPATGDWEGMTLAQVAAGITLQQLQNVGDSPTDGQFLQWDSSASEWITVGETSALADLTDVTLGGTAQDGDWLYHAAGIWTNITSATAGLLMAGNMDLENISDVTISSPTTGQVLTYDGSDWVNGGTGVEYFVENFCINQIPNASAADIGADVEYMLPGGLDNGMHNAYGDMGGSVLDNAATWNRFKKLSHRFPADTYDFDIHLDVSMTPDEDGLLNMSDYNSEVVYYEIKKITKGPIGGNVTFTNLDTGSVTMHSSDTAQSTTTDISLTNITLSASERILVVLKGSVVVPNTGDFYCHWTYDLVAKKQ